MARLLNLGLLLALGVLQVSAGESKDFVIGKQECEVKCFEKLEKVYELAEKYCQYIWKPDAALREKTFQSGLEVLAVSEQCCGKESEEKKCLEEANGKNDNLIRDLSVFANVLLNPLTQSFANISTLITYAENEVDCCCKLEACVSKIEVPVTNYKGSIKECKGECSKALNALLPKLVVWLQNMNSAIYQEGRLITALCTNLPKYKEHIPKDGKCKDEKDKEKGNQLGELRKELRNISFIANTLKLLQTVLNQQGTEVLQLVSAAAIESITCPIEKEEVYLYFPIAGQSFKPIDRSSGKKKKRSMDKVLFPSTWVKLIKDSLQKKPIDVHVKRSLIDNGEHDGTPVVEAFDFKDALDHALVRSIPEFTLIRVVYFHRGCLPEVHHKISSLLYRPQSLFRRVVRLQALHKAWDSAKNTPNTLPAIKKAKYYDVCSLLNMSFCQNVPHFMTQ